MEEWVKIHPFPPSSSEAGSAPLMVLVTATGAPDDVSDGRSCCLRRLTVPLNVGTDTPGQWQIFSAIIIVEGVAGGLDKEGEGWLKNCGFRESHKLG